MASSAELSNVNHGYFLLMCNLPATCTFKYLNLVKIRNFHLPVKIKDCGYLLIKNDRAVGMVEFFSKEDMESALEDIQTKYFEGLKIWWVYPEENWTSALPGNWDHIHRDLQLDILSYFDAFGRCRLRRVCRMHMWNELLETAWDKDINRCLYLDFSRAITGRTFGHTVDTMFIHVDGITSENRCALSRK